MKHVDVLIIGGGPAGISAAIWCKRLGVDHLVIEKTGSLGGQLKNIHNEIIDYPGIETKDGLGIQQALTKHFISSECAVMYNTEVSTIQAVEKSVTIHSEQIHYSFLILAAGSGPRALGVPGEAEMYARGENYSATLDGSSFNQKKVAVVGGGDRAFEGALLLADAGADVLLIHRSQTFKARKQYINAVLKHKNVHLYPHTQITKINGESNVTSIELVNVQGDKFSLEAEAVFVRIGTKPNTELVKGLVELNTENLIVTNHVGETSIPSIYAVGDITTAPLYTSIAGAVGQGAVTAKHVAYLLTKQEA